MYVFPIPDGQALVDDRAQIHPYAQLALSVLTTASSVCSYQPRWRRLIHFSTGDPIASEFGCIDYGPRYPNQANLRAHPGEQVTG